MKIDYPVELNIDFGEQDLFELNKEVFGKLIVTPRVDLEVEKIGYRFLVQTRGSLSPTSHQLSETILSDETVLEKGTKYSFDLSILNDQHPTYKGKNVDFLFKIEGFLILQKKETKKGFFAKIFKTDKDRIFKAENFLTFKAKPNLFYVKPLEIRLSQQSLMILMSYLVGFIIFLTVTVLFFGTYESVQEFFFTHQRKILILTAILTTGFLTYFLLAKILIGKIEAKFNDRNLELFEANLSSNWGLVRSISVNYYIEEKVIDDRGTSSSNYTHKFYESPAKNIKNPLKQVKVLFPYPEQIMPSIEIGDAKIHWFFQVKIKTYLGIPFRFDGVFTVGK